MVKKSNKSNSSINTCASHENAKKDAKSRSMDTIMGKSFTTKKNLKFLLTTCFIFKAIFETSKNKINRTISIASINLKFSIVNISHLSDDLNYNKLLTKINFTEPGEVISK